MLLLLTALRIHCSDECRQMLDKLGGYILEPRGTVTIKVSLLSPVFLLLSRVLHFLHVNCELL